MSAGQTANGAVTDAVDSGPFSAETTERLARLRARKSRLIPSLNTEFRAEPLEMNQLALLNSLPRMGRASCKKEEPRRAHVQADQLKPGHLVRARIVSKPTFGLVVSLRGIVSPVDLKETPITREHEKLMGFIQVAELSEEISENPSDYVAVRDEMQRYEVADEILAVVMMLDRANTRVLLSFLPSRLQPDVQGIVLGPYRRPESPPPVIADNYADELEAHRMFRNPHSTSMLMGYFGAKTGKSLLATLANVVEASDFREMLRDQQDECMSRMAVEAGVASQRAGNKAEAWKCYERALRHFPQNSDALVARGALRANTGDMDNAIRDLEEALLIDPDHKNATSYLSAVLLKRAGAREFNNKLHEAAEDYERVIKMNGEGLAKALVRLQDIQTTLAQRFKAAEQSQAAARAAFGSMDGTLKRPKIDPSTPTLEKHKGLADLSSAGKGRDSDRSARDKGRDSKKKKKKHKKSSSSSSSSKKNKKEHKKHKKSSNSHSKRRRRSRSASSDGSGSSDSSSDSEDESSSDSDGGRSKPKRAHSPSRHDHSFRH